MRTRTLIIAFILAIPTIVALPALAPSFLLTGHVMTGERIVLDLDDSLTMPRDLLIEGELVLLADDEVSLTIAGKLTVRGSIATESRAWSSIAGRSGISLSITAHAVHIAQGGMIAAEDGVNGASEAGGGRIDVIGGDGGAGGSITIATAKLVNDGTIKPGKGGAGGVAIGVNGASAHGGAGGPSGRAIWIHDAIIDLLAGAPGGDGGDAVTVGGIDQLLKHELLPAGMVICDIGRDCGPLNADSLCVERVCVDISSLCAACIVPLSPGGGSGDPNDPGGSGLPGMPGTPPACPETLPGPAAPGQPGTNVDNSGCDGEDGEDGDPGSNFPAGCTGGGPGGSASGGSNAGSAIGGAGGVGILAAGGAGGSASANGGSGGKGGNGGNGGKSWLGIVTCAGGNGGHGGSGGNAADAVGGPGGSALCGAGGKGGGASANAGGAGAGGAGGAGNPAGQPGLAGFAGTAALALDGPGGASVVCPIDIEEILPWV